MSETKRTNVTLFDPEHGLDELLVKIAEWYRENKPFVMTLVIDTNIFAPKAAVYWYPTNETPPYVFQLEKWRD